MANDFTANNFTVTSVEDTTRYLLGAGFNFQYQGEFTNNLKDIGQPACEIKRMVFRLPLPETISDVEGNKVRERVVQCLLDGGFRGFRISWMKGTESIHSIVLSEGNSTALSTKATVEIFFASPIRRYTPEQIETMVQEHDRFNLDVGLRNEGLID